MENTGSHVKVKRMIGQISHCLHKVLGVTYIIFLRISSVLFYLKLKLPGINIKIKNKYCFKIKKKRVRKELTIVSHLLQRDQQVLISWQH